MVLAGLISSCDNEKGAVAPAAPEVVSIKIPQPQNKKPEIKKPEIKKKVEPVKKAAVKEVKKDQPTSKIDAVTADTPEHYDSSGKIDPFIALIQEKREPAKAAVTQRPERILTPLEKIELSQIRLVAVVITERRRIAMVEEASGKGYEVGVGTFIGRNQGRITEIKENSIVIKEPVRDYMGKLSERVQEIKIHKSDVEG